MENIEFISAKDLPTTEAEEVDVLCVENGELKRKAGATLGGGGAGGYVITVSPDNIEEMDDGLALPDNFDDFADILYNGGTVWLDMTALMGVFSRCVASGWGYGNGVLQLQCSFTLSGIQQTMNFVFTNGTWTPPTV